MEPFLQPTPAPVVEQTQPVSPVAVPEPTPVVVDTGLVAAANQAQAAVAQEVPQNTAPHEVPQSVDPPATVAPVEVPAPVSPQPVSTEPIHIAEPVPSYQERVQAEREARKAAFTAAVLKARTPEEKPIVVQPVAPQIMAQTQRELAAGAAAVAKAEAAKIVRPPTPPNPAEGTTVPVFRPVSGQGAGTDGKKERQGPIGGLG